MAKKSQEIATLIRVQSWSVDEQRRILGQMQDREHALLEDGLRMDRELIMEQQVAGANPTLAGHAYAAFAKLHAVRRDNLNKVIEALRAEIEQQRDALAEAYRELKVLEEVQKAWIKAEREEEARIEQINLDEIAQTLYRRQQADA